MVEFAQSIDSLPELPGYDQAEIEIPKPKKVHALIKQLEEGNIVSKLDDHKDKTPATIYEDIQQAYGDAEESMESWFRKYKAAIKLAKMQPTAGGKDIDTKDFPFPGASVAMMPFVLQAMLDFAARATPDLVWTDKLVSAQVQGMDREQTKLARAIRVETYMNYQIINDIPGWRKGQDKNMFALPCVGTTYKKTYFDYEAKKVCSDFRMADRVIFDLSHDTFEDAPDKFEPITYSRNDVIGFIRGSQEWDISEDTELEDDKNSFDFVEAHCWIDLDGDGLKEPYCAVLFPEVNRIVCLYPDYDEDTIVFNDKGQVVKIKDQETYTQYIFLPDPEGGPMGLGWGILLGPMYAAINTLVRDNLDAGTLSLTSSNSGLIAQSIGGGRGNRQLSSRVDVKIGQLTPYPMGALNGSLRENVVQFPFAGASPVLMQLTEYLVNASQQMTVAAYQVEANQGEAASLYLARLQQGLKTPNMIVMRVYEAAKCEFQKIGALNYKHYDNFYYNKILDEQMPVDMQADFNPDECDIDLVADPAQGSDVERVGKAQTIYDLAIGQLNLAAPQTIINLREATIKLMEAMQIPDDDIEILCPAPDPNAPPSKTEQLLLAQQAFEADLKQQAVKNEGMKIQVDAENKGRENDRKDEETKATIQKVLAEISELEARKQVASAQAEKYRAEAAAITRGPDENHAKVIELQERHGQMINAAQESDARVRKLEAEIQLLAAKAATEQDKPALARESTKGE